MRAGSTPPKGMWPVIWVDVDILGTPIPQRAAGKLLSSALITKLQCIIRGCPASEGRSSFGAALSRRVAIENLNIPAG